MKREMLFMQQRFSKRVEWKLIVLFFFLASLWYWGGLNFLSKEEDFLWRKVRSAQDFLYTWRVEHDLQSSALEDPWETGFIGVEWSGITTTLGPIEAKRTATDPLWAVHVLRHYRKMGLSKGDPIAIVSSSSFPGLLYAVLAATEFLELRVLWIHSLGSSTWGANHQELPWPDIADILRKGGFLSTKVDFYTLGGKSEMGLDMPEEAREMLKNRVFSEGGALLETPSLAEMIQKKMEKLRDFSPKLLVTLGGSSATFGEGLLELPGGGYYPPGAWGKEEAFAEGVFFKALRENYPVLHFLNLRQLSFLASIPYDNKPLPRFASRTTFSFSFFGILCFFFFLMYHQRWKRYEC